MYSLIFCFVSNIILYMKVVIVGYGEMFSSLIAGVMNAGHEIVGVFRHENVLYSPFKRFIFDKLIPSADRLFVKNLGLHDIKAKSVNSEKFQDEIKRLNADIILVCSWSEKFSAQTLNTPKIACINTHPSLLPKYRGPNPYTQVILSGEETSGITFHLMDVNYDTGAILHQKQTEVSKEDTGLSLKLKCCNIARKEIVNLFETFEDKISNPISQNEKDATYFHQVELGDSILNFKEETANEIERRIRALTPWLNCHIAYKNEFFKFERYKILPRKSIKEPATIVKKSGRTLAIVCNDNKIIEFYGLKLKRPIAQLFTGLYIKHFVDINSQVK